MPSFWRASFIVSLIFSCSFGASSYYATVGESFSKTGILSKFGFTVSTFDKKFGPVPVAVLTRLGASSHCASTSGYLILFSFETAPSTYLLLTGAGLIFSTIFFLPSLVLTTSLTFCTLSAFATFSRLSTFST